MGFVGLAGLFSHMHVSLTYSKQIQCGSLIYSLLFHRKFFFVSYTIKNPAALRKVFLNIFLNLTCKTVKHFCHLTITEKRKKHHIKVRLYDTVFSSSLFFLLHCRVQMIQ